MILDHDQVASLAEAAGSQGLVITFLAYTGLRWGEMTALRARDIDLTRRRVDVRRAYSDVGGRLELDAPKSARSHRTVPVPGFLAEQLAEHMKGLDWTALVFTTAGGQSPAAVQPATGRLHPGVPGGGDAGRAAAT